MSFKDKIDALLEESIREILEEGSCSKRMKKEKMDPVGKADADIDNDGDVDDSDEYLHNRRKTIKKAMKKESVELDEGIIDKVKAGIKKVLGKHRLDKAQHKASVELRSYYDDWIASGGDDERFKELVYGTGKQMGLDIEPDEVFKDWLPKVRRANRRDDRLRALGRKVYGGGK